MEITQIKQRLTLSQVLHYYHLKPNKQLQLNCPFHDDKTPSMQVYYKTHTAYCFSSNCKTHGKSLDVIDFIMHKESYTKREAILKAVEMIKGSSSNHKPISELTRVAVLTKMFTYFKNAIHSSNPAKEYLSKRGLDHTATEVGYNSGQFHHGSRRDTMLIESCLKYGLLIDKGSKARTGNPAYNIFGKWGLVFPLKNKENQIVSLYFRSTLENKNQRHFYLKDRQGLYPKYPSENNTKLILTESIIDAASLLEQEDIKSEFEILSLYGTNGLTAEHSLAIKNWVNNGVQKSEIIFFLNGDAPGVKAVEKYASILKEEYPSVIISTVDVPENEDVNSLLQGHPPVVGHSDRNILSHLIDSRKKHNFLFCGEPPRANTFFSSEDGSSSNEKVIIPESQVKGLDTENPYNIKYKGQGAHYQIKGFKTTQMDSLKITLQITGL